MVLWAVPVDCWGVGIALSGALDGVVMSEGWQLVVGVLEQILLRVVDFVVMPP